MLDRNFTEVLAQSVRDNWNQKAFSDYQGETYTYAEVAAYITRLHIVFERNGLQKGDKVSILGKNSRNWALSYMATCLYGAVTVPILPDFHEEDIVHIVQHSDSKIFFSQADLYNKLDKKELSQLDAIIDLNTFGFLDGKTAGYQSDLVNLDGLFSEKFPNGLQPADFKTTPTEPTDIVTINYTSGTSGYSKGVVLNYNSFMANLQYAQDNMPLQPGEEIVAFLPLAHTYGCAFDFIFPFSIGCHITFLGKIPSPQVILKAFQDIRPHLVMFVPLVLEKIYKSKLLPVLNKPVMKILVHVPLLNQVIFKKINKTLTESFGSRFREIVIGGAALNKEVERFLKKIKFKFAIGYGMTECGPLISYDPWNTRKLTSAGKPVDTLEMKIDSDDPQNEVGEIMVKGDNVMIGYYKNEEATKACLSDDGWLRTGDLGILDKDNYVFIKGRSKSMILGPSGQNIYPEIVEGRINNMPYVIESVVVERDQKMIALVFPDREAAKNDGLDESGLSEAMEKNRQHLNSKLPKFMQVKTFELVNEEFEKTPKKSIKRYLYT